MSADFWYPWYPAAFKKKTRHLTAEQDGIYRRLIDEYMETREPLPDDDVALARIAGVSENKWLDAKRIVLAFFTHKNGMLFQKNCDEQLDIQDKRSKRKTDSAEKAARIRWENKKNKTEQIQKDKCDTHNDRIPSAMRSDATATVTVTKRDTNVSLPPTPQASGNDPEVLEAFTLYNQLATETGLPIAQVLNKIRSGRIKARLKDAGGIEGWKAALEKVKASDFCSGRKTDFKASIDFIIQGESFIKIMEGNYDNDRKQRDSNQGGRPAYDAGMEGFSRAADRHARERRNDMGARGDAPGDIFAQGEGF